MGIYAVEKLMMEARRLAAEYRRATGQPLGISAEIAAFDACRLLDLESRSIPEGGYDAVGRGARAGKRVQVKGRAILDEHKSGQRIGQLKLDKDWDSVMLVLMDDNYEPVSIYEAERREIEEALAQSKSERRNKRGAMSVAKFKVIARLVWSREEGVIGDEVWSNQPEAG